MPNEYEIEIIDSSAIDGGIEIFARAWKNGVQLGFGKDGTIDIERFRIFNPPILVDDPLGDIVIQGGYDEVSKTTIPERRLREDPLMAIQEALVDVIRIVGIEGSEIQAGKIGNTTSTFYPHASDGTIGGSNTTWSTIRDATTATKVDNETRRWVMADKDGATYTISRAFFNFDTSAIPDTDTVSAATLTLTVDLAGEGTAMGGVIQTTTASDTALVDGDYDALTLNSAPEATTSRVSMVTTGAKNFVFNATGIGWISKTGYTKLGLRLDKDLDNSAPTARNYCGIYLSEQTGTTSDPTLVVVHAASSVNVTVSAGVNAGTFSIPTYTPKTAQILSATTQTGTLSAIARAILAGVKINPATQTATFTIPAFSVLSSSGLVAANTQSATFAVPVYDAKTYILVMPNGQELTYTIPAYAVETTAHITYTPDTISLTFETVTLQRVGATWRKSSRNDTGTWTKISRNSN